jgi:vacuolar-type H+-ATPase subunit E/Vma4
LADSKIKEKILRDAKDDAENILKEARESAAAIAQRSKKEVEDIKTETQTLAQETKQKEIDRRLSAARMKSRKDLLQEKRNIIDAVFDDVKKRLQELEKGAYIRFIAKLIKGEVSSGKPTLVLSEADFKKHGENVAKDILKASGAKDMIPVEKGRFDGGCIIKHEDYEFNATLDTIISRIKEQKESALQKILFS